MNLKRIPMSKWVPTTNLLELRRFGKLGEELGELQAVISRCIIQGLDGLDPATKKINRRRLEEECADVQAQIETTIKALDLDRMFIVCRNGEKQSQMNEWEALFSDRKE